MMKFYRKNIKLFIWLIVLAFVIWGAGTLSVSQDSASSHAGSVYGKKISHKEFLMTSRFYDLLIRARNIDEPIKSQSKPESEAADQALVQTADPNPEPPSADQVRGMAWQTILLSKEAEREKVVVSNEEVRAEVERLFSGEGAFNQERYRAWIENNFRSRPRDFEEVVRNHLAAQKLREHVVKDVPENEKESRWMTWLISAFSRAQLQDYTAQKEKKEAVKVQGEPSPSPLSAQSAEGRIRPNFGGQDGGSASGGAGGGRDGGIENSSNSSPPPYSSPAEWGGNS